DSVTFLDIEADSIKESGELPTGHSRSGAEQRADPGASLPFGLDVIGNFEPDLMSADKCSRHLGFHQIHSGTNRAYRRLRRTASRQPQTVITARYHIVIGSIAWPSYGASTTLIWCVDV